MVRMKFKEGYEPMTLQYVLIMVLEVEFQKKKKKMQNIVPEGSDNQNSLQLFNIGGEGMKLFQAAFGWQNIDLNLNFRSIDFNCLDFKLIHFKIPYLDLLYTKRFEILHFKFHCQLIHFTSHKFFFF